MSYISSCSLKQTEQGQGFMGKVVFIWEIQTACWFTGLGLWFPLDPHLPYWKALWIIASKKWHKLYCIFICQMYSCSKGGAQGLDWESIREWNELLSVPRSIACLASGATTLYWGGKSETHPGISPVASCWVLTLQAVETKPPYQKIFPHSH